VNDPGIFKAVFMAGCPGSGKGTVLRTIFGTNAGTTHTGLKIVNSDQLYEYLLTSSGMPLSAPKMPDAAPWTPAAYRSEAGRLQHRAVMKTTGGSKGISPGHVGLDPLAHGFKPAKKERGASQLEMYINGRLGLIIDGTAANFDKISREKEILETLGYDTMMIAVNVPLEIAMERNAQRAQSGKRAINKWAVLRTCKSVIPNLPRYNALFGASYIEIDNTLPPGEAISQEIIKQVDDFVSAPLTAQATHNWTGT
jgi:predicted ABC-type ATPase